jgi:hypothetical protein
MTAAGEIMNEKKTDTSAETFQEGTAPVQAFTSGVVAVTPDKAALTRRGRPPRILREEKVDSKKGTKPTAAGASAKAQPLDGLQSQEGAP